ncbi:pumilio-like protein 5 [Iris pallida]|uniref:Pumilio-like protein 5 n=1 Tax=Iris pallida TaxID=29817 RepID=A0AAX6EZ02_IRIPA|nr:pumilio-like protein 5 [Iris pallida]
MMTCLNYIAENPVRLIGGSSGARNWPIAKDAAPFTSSARELGLLLQGPSFHGNTNIAGPNRSGSAPPTIQGSSLAIGDLRGNLNSTLEGIFEGLSTALHTSESEEQLRADPAYRAYYYSNVNLNPRLPQPLLSRENPRLLHQVGAFGGNGRRISFDDSTKKPFMSPPVLSTHKEEPEDDRSPRLDSEGKGERDSGFISTSLQGHHKSLVDLIQEDFPRTPSPVYNNQSHLANQGTIEQADPDPGINLLQESSINISKAESKTATIGICSQTPIASAHSVGSGPNIDLTSSLIALPTSSDIKLNPHPGQKGESRTFNVNLDNGILPSDKAISSAGSVDNETKNLRLSHDLHRGQPAHQHPQQENLHPRGSSFQAQIVHQGMPSSSNAAIHFSHSQPNIPSAIQPVLQPAGSAPPLYATAAAYGNPYYPNLRPSSLFPPFSFGGYALNTSLVSPFVTGYQPYTAIHMPLENSASPNLHGRTSGLSGGSVTHEADVQHLYKFYGQFGVAPQPSFPDPIYMPYFQHSSVNAYASAGQYDQMAARESTIGSPAGNYDRQLGPRAAAQSPEQRPQIVRSGAANSPGARKGGAASPNNSGSPPNIGIMLHYPSSPLASPVYQGSPVAAGRRNENMRFQVNSSRNGGAFFGWQGQRGREKFDEQKKHSFLEELKSSKARRYELSDIAGRLVEFRQCRPTWESIYSAEARDL